MVVFLAGRGQEVESLNAEEQREFAAAGRFRYVTYSGAIQQWLADCMQVCRAERVKRTLSAFSEYIEDCYGATSAYLEGGNTWRDTTRVS
jgi:phage FluMu gp28-like protein